MHQVERAGSFRGVITDYGLYQSTNSQSLGINITAHLKEIWDGEEWQDWEKYQVEAKGCIYIIKKEGEVNNGQVETLVNIANWDGSLETIANRTWDPPQLQFTVTEEEYKGSKRYRIAFLNDFNRTPGGGSNVSPEDVGKLKNLHGGKLRAVVSQIKKVPNSGPANGSRPPMSPPRQPTPVAPPAVAIAANGEHDGTIPF